MSSHLIQENISLAGLNTFKVGGKAKFFSSISSVAELKKVFEFIKEKKINFFVLGEGSNTVISDEGFDGLVLRVNMKGKEWKEGEESVTVKVGAGENWDDFVKGSVERGLYGVENLSGIPGSIGASPVQNIGAYGKEAKDAIQKVEVFDPVRMETFILSNEECEFGYRDSFFKSEKGKNLVVLNVFFLLKKHSEVDINYKDLKEYFKDREQIKLEEVRRAVLEIRKNKLPDLKIFGTAGSFFKNPVLSKEEFEELKSKYENLPFYETKDGFKIPLAWIMDKVCNLKGLRKGNVGLYENQPLVIVNFGGASGREIKDFSDRIKKDMEEKTKIKIENEVLFVGNFF